jgi:hypothetical protein
MFDPTRSVLGRWLRKDSDRLRGEARFYLFAVTGTVLLLLTSLIIWALIKDQVVAEPQGTAALVFYVGQLLYAGTFVLTCMLGFRPRIVVTLSRGMIEVRQGQGSMILRTRDIKNIEIVSGSTLPRHYRRFASLSEFSGRSQQNYLLLKTADRALVLGLTGPQQDEFLSLLRKEELPNPIPLLRVAQ